MAQTYIDDPDLAIGNNKSHRLWKRVSGDDGDKIDFFFWDPSAKTANKIQLLLAAGVTTLKLALERSCRRLRPTSPPEGRRQFSRRPRGEASSFNSISIFPLSSFLSRGLYPTKDISSPRSSGSRGRRRWPHIHTFSRGFRQFLFRNFDASRNCRWPFFSQKLFPLHSSAIATAATTAKLCDSVSVLHASLSVFCRNVIVLVCECYAYFKMEYFMSGCGELKDDDRDAYLSSRKCTTSTCSGWRKRKEATTRKKVILLYPK